MVLFLFNDIPSMWMDEYTSAFDMMRLLLTLMHTVVVLSMYMSYFTYYSGALTIRGFADFKGMSGEIILGEGIYLSLLNRTLLPPSLLIIEQWCSIPGSEARWEL